MVTFNTVHADGLVIRTAWDEYHLGPVELLITIDHGVYPAGRGISERAIHRLSLQSMTPESLKIFGSLRVVGDWLEKNRPKFRKRPEDSSAFFAHVALFFVLAIQEGEKGVVRVLANYVGVTPSMAKLWIDGARKRGLLTENEGKCRTGRAQGILTDKARAILASQSQMEQLAA